MKYCNHFSAGHKPVFHRLTTLLLLTLIMGLPSVWAQNYYVFQNNTYGYIVNNNGTLAANTIFSPAAVFQASGQMGNTNRTLQSYTNTSQWLSYVPGGTLGYKPAIGAASFNYWKLNSNYLYSSYNNETYYVKWNNSAIEFATGTTGNRFYAYSVTITGVAAALDTRHTVTGPEAITATGNYYYDHSTATAIPAYVNYRFNNTDHYAIGNGNGSSSIPAAVNYGNYTWSVSNNDYATINSSTGVLTVNSLPSGQTPITITCTATQAGLPQTVSTLTVYLSGNGQVSITGLYVITNGTYYFGGSNTDGINTFSPSTCLWTVNNDIWHNSGGYYLYNVNANNARQNRDGTVTLEQAGTDRPWTLEGTESGTSGRRITRTATNKRYLYYNNGWKSTTSTTNTNVVFNATKKIIGEQSTAPTISGDNQISLLGSNNSFTRTEASYTRGYINYVFRNNANHYFEMDNQTGINAAPTTDDFTYVWSLEGISSSYATINASTGVITYSNYVTSTTTATVKLTATSQRDNNIKYVASQEVLFRIPTNPNDMAITSSSPITVSVMGSSTITYSLTPANCYDNVTFTSNNTDIATVDANGVVTGVEEGNTTITVTAHNYDGTTAAQSTVDVTVTPAQLYVIFNNRYSVYLGGSTTSGTTDFNPSTCIWIGSNGGTWKNTAGYYLGENPLLTDNSSSAVNIRLDGTESGTTGQKMYRGTSTDYLRWSNSGSTWQWRNNYDENNVVFAVTRAKYPEQQTNPTISGDDVIAQTGINTFTHTDAIFHIAYYDYIFCDGAHHYFQTDNVTPMTDPNVTFTYTWSLEGIPAANATINATTGAINYISYVASDVTATVKLTATSTNPNRNIVVTQQVTFKPPITPTSISITSNNPITVYVGQTSNIHYTLQPENCYDNVTYQSANTSRATVNANGVVTGVSVGQTTVTATANKYGGGAGAPTATVTVNVRDKVATPVITFNGSGETASTTITCSTSSTTIHYSINGGAEQTYSGAFTVNTRDVVTAYATSSNSYYDQSDVAEANYLLESGIRGGKVLLNDAEPHSWTIYQPTINGQPNPIYLPEPKDVKITYEGNGGAVSMYNPETTFVYYKTLTKENNTYQYTTIPNPFSKRPKYGSDQQGFNRWKVTRLVGGTITNAGGTNIAVNSYVSAEETLNFNPTNEYGMEVDFEVEWAKAYVITCDASSVNTDIANSYLAGGSYERNFIVIRNNTRSSTSLTASSSYPVTITMVAPDGSADYRSPNTYLNPTTITLSNDWKFEYINLNSATIINATNHYLIMGRGVANTSSNGVCANYIRGLHQDVANLNTKMRIESGIYNYFSAVRGYNGSQETPTVTGTMSTTGVLGCDYDRAANDNTKMKIQQQVWMGYVKSPSVSNTNLTRETFNYTVKSGDLHSAISNNKAAAEEAFYISCAAAYTNVGRRVLKIEGGQLLSVAGGIDKDNSADLDAVEIRMTGGTLRGCMYGAAAFADTKGNRRFIITGGTIRGWVAGGCNGTDNNTDGGVLPSTTRVYIGGNAEVGNRNGGTLHINFSDGGNVFGAGSGNSNRPGTGEAYYTNVVVADNCYIQRDVYGGGNYGFCSNDAKLYVMGGQVDGMVFGGANQKQGKNASIYMKDGLVKGGIYGGSNVTGVLSGSVNIQVDGGTVGQSGVTELDGNRVGIFGGGLGSPTEVSQNVDITLGYTGQTAGTGVTLYGDVYGGSALGKVNGTSANTTYHTNVTLNAGTIYGSLYGGGLGNNSNAANVYSPVQVKVYGGSVKKTSADGSGGVYGANNINGAPQRSVTVDIYGTDAASSDDDYALYAVYGGGNKADYTYGNGYPTVTVHNCNNSIEYVYGGGNAAAVAATNVTIWGGNIIGNVFGGGNGTVQAANVSGNAVTKIYGGTIGNVYGGSNTQGTIGGTISVTAVEATEAGHPDCPINVTNLYGGGNKAASNAANISIGCANHIGSVYGGANQANISGDINLNITAGHIDNVFGGNNTSGSISGTITVTVDDEGEQCGMLVGNVYGGGNKAAYGTSGLYPKVNILNGHVTGSVYGGGLGSTAAVTGSPQVVIGRDNATGNVQIDGSVYGGGNAAPVGSASSQANTNVQVKLGTISNYVFGGGLGNTAVVNGNTSVTISGKSNIGKNVYGGGNAALVTGNTNIVIQ